MKFTFTERDIFAVISNVKQLSLEQLKIVFDYRSGESLEREVRNLVRAGQLSLSEDGILTPLGHKPSYEVDNMIWVILQNIESVEDLDKVKFFKDIIVSKKTFFSYVFVKNEIAYYIAYADRKNKETLVNQLEEHLDGRASRTAKLTAKIMICSDTKTTLESIEKGEYPTLKILVSKPRKKSVEKPNIHEVA
ncbi:hypothetical protein M2146_001048 [Lachnospiraceae bacterium PF1-22]